MYINVQSETVVVYVRYLYISLMKNREVLDRYFNKLVKQVVFVTLKIFQVTIRQQCILNR